MRSNYKYKLLGLLLSMVQVVCITADDFGYEHKDDKGCTVTITNPTPSTVFITHDPTMGDHPYATNLERAGIKSVEPYQTTTFMFLDQVDKPFYIYTRQCHSNNIYEKHFSVTQKACTEFGADSFLDICELDGHDDATRHFTVVDLLTPAQSTTTKKAV